METISKEIENVFKDVKNVCLEKKSGKNQTFYLVAKM